MPGPHPGFNKNVFINCPFDGDYSPLLQPILFTIIYFGFTPQIASQTTDSGEQRINKILSLILKSRYSLHDLSRIKSQRRGEFFRLNIPFELGIDYGCRRTAAGYLRRKRFLVLGRKPHDYRQALSDLGGIDAKSHWNNPKKAVLALRNWFIDTVHIKEAPSGSAIWEKFVDFDWDFYAERKRDGFSRHDLNMMPIREYISAIRRWLKKHG
ncbi:MAG: hypothetical protein V7638_1818 [Acidobacteriota bacterium]|jgi:hypothetical protein